MFGIVFEFKFRFQSPHIPIESETNATSRCAHTLIQIACVDVLVLVTKKFVFFLLLFTNNTVHFHLNHVFLTLHTILNSVNNATLAIYPSKSNRFSRLFPSIPSRLFCLIMDRFRQPFTPDAFLSRCIARTSSIDTIKPHNRNVMTFQMFLHILLLLLAYFN